MSNSNINETQDLDQGETTLDGSSPVQPQAIGRFRVIGLLGQGGFGLVYLARDERLNRQVAVKVPHARLVSRPEDAQAYLDEARTVANLDHPNIVPVYDVGSTDEFPCYVVSKFIDGQNLATRNRNRRPTSNEAAELVATVAEALHHAHKHGLVHRDIKPGNILIERSGKPFVVDFGLALREEDLGKGPRYAGTPPYMSPEQARGEGHRLDGRSDIFSLGVVLYELLTGRRPFSTSSRQELLDLIATTEARPPRQIDDTIPKELERICLKALSKKAVSRYTTAKDMADELRYYLAELAVALSTSIPVPTAPSQSASPSPPFSAPPQTSPAAIGSTPPVTPSDPQPVKIVPKGLRSFDQHDADFFLELLPGPRDRDGLPESIRFWKTRIEEADGDKTFSVGLIYGPSGCGKSSLVKAGLLPRLGDHVLSVYLDATPNETETRLLYGLRKRAPGLPQNLALKETLAALRRGQGLTVGKKVLIVLDQFEQWLHSKKDEQNTELVQALRQCDGGNVQSIVLVRDDFWLAVSRFMRELEVRLVDGLNMALVDVFDADHARSVLAAFGRAFGRLPESGTTISIEQKQFLDEATRGLSEEGKVISVRLALFAEMMKAKHWTPSTLRAVGGTRGVGVTFLEETFSASTAPPGHRYHQKAARSVLKTLLPESGSDIKGYMRSYDDLLDASGYSDRLKEFDDLMRILDAEIRLITPTDPEGVQTSDTSPSNTEPGRKYYQLTHDYLVHSLRDWLTRKQRETRRGRAELQLAERSASWNAKPENRQLPSALEWVNIRLLTSKKHWTDPQSIMMKRAGRIYGIRGLALSILVAIMCWAAYEINGRLKSQMLRDKLLASPLSDIPGVITQIKPYRRWIDPLLREAFAEAKKNANPPKQLNAALALLPVDDNQLPYLKDRLFRCDAQDISVVRQSLAGHKDSLVSECWRVLEKPEPRDHAKALQAASALALYDPNNAHWASISSDVANRLVAENAYVVSHWIDALRPVADRLSYPLVTIFQDSKRRDSERNQAANVLSEYLSDQPKLSARLLLDATETQFILLYPGVAKQEDQTSLILEAELAREPPGSPTSSESGEDKNPWSEFYTRQAKAAVALIRMGRLEKSWPLLKHSDDPSLRSYLIHQLGPLGYDFASLTNRLGQEGDVSIRRALILSMGEYPEGQLSTMERDAWTRKLFDLYRNDPDPGIHSASDWLLRRWGSDRQLKVIDRDLALLPAPTLGGTRKFGNSQNNDHRWYVNSENHTMVIITAPIEVNSEIKPDKSVNASVLSSAKQRRVEHSFAIATREITVQDFQVFLQENPRIRARNNEQYSPAKTCPMNSASWYDTAAYCNWLSKKANIPEGQWCYVPNEKGEYGEGMALSPDADKKIGYRLPTEDEWELSCSAGATTEYSFGSSWALMAKYDWFRNNSPKTTQPVGSLKPNEFGLFDVHGNVSEWCLDKPDYKEYYKSDGRLILLSGRYRGRVGTRYAVDNTLGDTVLSGISEADYNRAVINDKIPRLCRGGDFYHEANLARISARQAILPTNRYIGTGFRPARTYP